MLRAKLESRLNRTWYGPRQPGVVLRTLERLYARLAARRHSRLLADRPRDLEDQPIVVVGNITAGGTGKTPLVIRLCQLLRSSGLKPAVVSRGYGRSGSGQLLLNPDTPVSQSGDEPRLIMERTGVEVAVGTDRNASARMLFQRGADLVISDDGLQRSDFPRKFEICVIDGERGLGNGRLLPAGPLREGPERLAKVDAIIVNQSPGTDTPPSLREHSTVAMRLEPGHVHGLSGQQPLQVSDWIDRHRDRKVTAVAGIGHPKRFFSQLTRLGFDFQPRAFPDHHTYTAADFSVDGDRAIIMTEKDAVKCRRLKLGNAWYLPVSAHLPEEWEQAFVDRVMTLVNSLKPSK